MMEEIDQLFDVGKDILNLPEDAKQRYLHDIPKSFLGFKPRGQAKIETNEPDRFEWFNLGQDSIMGTETTQPIPPLVQTHMSLFASFLEHGQSILATINTTLATQLALPPYAFACLQTPTRPSGTVVRIIKAFAAERDEDVRTSMIHHTDFGTITLLANVVGGLQVLAPGKSPAA
ncbi:oxidoreductase [Apiospora hydei]|uniref:Oxidoreductase n=1 Tax=Apiospora hydei TaxID=1337664 RepID=A0ABR1X380_9PEZI